MNRRVRFVRIRRRLTSLLRAPPVAGILMYHRIAHPHSAPTHLRALCVSPARFQEQMEVLRQRFSVVALADVVDRRFQVRAPTVAVTFDDGYVDNLHCAVPTLERLDLPAEIFVASGYVGSGQPYWWDELYARGQAAGLGAADLTRRHSSLCTLSLSERRRQLDTLPGAEVEPNCRPMTVPELCSLRNHSLVTIGAHTSTHPRLSGISAADQLRELAESMVTLEKWLDSPVDGVALPFGGRPDYTKETIAAVRRCGFRYCCTTIDGVLHEKQTVFELPRLMVLDWNGDDFERCLTQWLGSSVAGVFS